MAKRVHHRRSRSHRRRSYRRNPPGISAGNLMSMAGYVALGVAMQRLAIGIVLPMIGLNIAAGTGDVTRIIAKFGMAYVIDMFAGKLVGSGNARTVVLGALADPVSDAITTYIGPSFPSLADYSQHGGMGLPMLEDHRLMLHGGFEDPMQLS